MNYELFFKASERQPDRHDFEEYFDGRLHYSIDDTAVWYENESTGVYFSFELSDSACDEDDFGGEETEAKNASDDEGDDYWVAFSMHCMRPHVFALEALPEVRAFIEHFKLLVIDPQSAGSNLGPFSDAGFLNGWNKGNERAFQAARADGAPIPLAYPTASLERNWRWNFDVVERQERLHEDVFIPTIMYVKHHNTVKSVVVWPDAIPIFIPQVDIVIVARNALAQPPISDNAQGETTVVDWSALQPLLADYPHEQTPAPNYKLAYEKAPEKLVQFIQSLPICEEEMDGLGKDEIVNAELVANAPPKSQSA